MKASFNKKSPKQILGYLMVLCMALCTYTINAQISNSGDNFIPATLNVTVGDTVFFNLGSSHDVVEVDQATWLANGNTPLPGGFFTPFGGGSVILSVAQTYYYVCTPHASGGMKGTITASSSPPCIHTFNMYDTFGDGWNGASVDVTVNGTVVVTGATIPTGASASAAITASTGDVIDLTNWVSGSYNSEIAWDITDSWGAVLAMGIYGGTGPATGNCVAPPSCTDNDVTIVVGGGSFATEVGWSLVDGSGAIVASASAPSGTGTWTACLPNDCYTMNMTDTYGDGWNGNTYTITDNNTGVVYGTGTLASGSSASELVSIGAVCPVYGCTDPLAANYDPLATIDDGSCLYAAGCTSGIGANSESFEDPLVPLYGQGPWAEWTYDAATSTFTSTNGWRKDNLGTGSGGTGPLNGQPSADGAYYLYCETSGQYGKIANLHSNCIDLSNFASPGFVFSYHMLGATMGTLNVDVSTDGAITWTNIWTQSGDQGSAWLDGIIDLGPSYAGQIVQLRMNYTSGTSFTGDCAIDWLRFMEMPMAGCMDPFASNYDPTATIDDGSCLYPGCMDPAATNYCSSCNVNDSASCIYPSTNALDFCDDFESASFTTNGWTTISGSEGGVSIHLTSANAISDTVSIESIGASAVGGWTQYSTEAQAFANVSHVSSATILFDMSASTGPVDLAFDYETQSGFSNTAPGLPGTAYSTMRVKVNGTVVQDVNGISWHGLAGSLVYDLSSYSGQSQVAVTFETACKYNSSYSSGAYGDYVWIDNVCASYLTPCAYYGIDAVVGADASCNGSSDGSASASATGMSTSFTYTNSYSWSNGDTTASISGLSAGTYTCTVSDGTNGCSASASVTIAEPSAIAISAAILPTTTPMNFDGAVDITVSGGIPCQTSAAVTAGAHASVYLGYARGWSFTAQSSFNLSHVRAADATILDPTLVEQSIEILDITSGVVSIYYAANQPTGWLATGGISIVAGNTYAIVGAKHATSPVAFGMANSYGASGQSFMIDGISTPVMRCGAQGNLSMGQVNAGGGTWLPPVAGSIGRLEIMTGVVGANPYTYAWSTGDTTEDVSNLGMGPITVTVTDCNGCTGIWSGFIMAASTPGCTDPTASNFDPTANADCAGVAGGTDYSCCLYPGCTDTLANNYDPIANVDDGSCTYSCAYYGLQDITIVVTTNLWPTEVSWDITDANGVVVASAASPNAIGTFNVCLPWGCYNFNMYDSYGDGWNGSTYTVSSTNSGYVWSTGTLVTGLFGTNPFCLDPCGAFALSATVTDATCNGGSDGSIDMNTLAGASYSWSNGATTEDISGLSAGVYTVIASDGSCSDTLDVTVGEPAAITALMYVVNESAAGAGDGQIDLTVSGGTPCATSDTIIPGPHVSNYTSTFTRGYYFHAQSSFNISGVRCSDDNTPGTGTYQSVEIVDLGTSPAVPYPGPGGPHTTLFSAIGDPMGWIPCNVSVVAGNYYGVIGAKHATAGGTSQTMYNSYGQPNPSVTIDGNATTLTRFLLQGSLAAGSPASGMYMAEVTGAIGRIEIATGVVGANAYTYAWSTGDTTEDISGLSAGGYCVTVTDCNGCSASACETVIIAGTPGCTDPLASNYNAFATYDDGSCLYPGCTDSLALNFDPTSNIDDGSCNYPCANGIGANSESFEDPLVPLYGQGPWANWTYDAATSTFTGTNGWRKDNLGTGSTGTGPLNGQPSLDGAYYLYCETSGQYNRVANLVSSCIDLNLFNCPSFVFGYHMLGATMGTLNVDVSNDGGVTWTTEWTKSGDQGSAWQEGVVMLNNSYAGQSIQVRMNYTSGTSYTGDCAIDFLRFMECPLNGCMDPAASNYDPSATIDDGSCQYIGCGDPLATNYDPLANSGCCGDWAAGTWMNGCPNGACGGNAYVLGEANDGSWSMDTMWWDSSPSTTVDPVTGYVTITSVYIGNMTSCEYTGVATSTNVSTHDPLNGYAIVGTVSFTVTGTGGFSFSSIGTFTGVDAAGNLLGTLASSAGSGTSTSCCTYPTCQPYPFSEDWESGSTATQDWLTSSGSNAEVYLQNAAVAGGMPLGTMMPVINGAYHLEMTGNATAGSYFNYATETGAYANTLHVASATVCLDMSNSGASVEMTFIGQVISYFSNVGYAWGRVKVDGVVIADVNGNTAYNNSTISTLMGADWTYDMSAYSGMSSVHVTFEFAGRYNTSYSSGNYGCFFRVDDIALYDLSPCSYYAVSATVDSDVSCNGGSDGSATASVSGGSGSNSYSWSNGATTASISGLSAGTYTCITTDLVHGCSDSVSVTVSEPSSISLSATVVDESAAGNDGSIDLSVSGGTPCVVNADLITPVLGGNGQSGCLFNVINTSGAPLTITGFSQGGTYVLNNNPMEVWMATGPAVYGTSPNGVGAPPYAGTYNFVLVGSANVTTTGGISLGLIPVSGVTLATGETRCFRVQSMGVTISYTNGTGTAGVTPWASDANVTITQGHGGANTGWFAFVPRNFNGAVHYGAPGASAYTFAWSTGDTTEDISGLSAGGYSVTVTDCNGCSASASYTVLGSAVLGCTDSTACNFDPLADTDDGSCDFSCYGCTDPTACNYDPLATIGDSSCSGSFGCMDTTSLNYDPSASCNDTGSPNFVPCIPIVYGCTDPLAINYAGGANVDNGTCVYVPGCMDPTACNYDPLADIDDGSCEWTSCVGCGAITGVNMTDVIHDRATFNWDDMNDSSCVVDQIRIRYSDDGGASYSTKTMGAPVGNNAPAYNTSKRVLNLTASTAYVYDFKIWYQDGTVVSWHANGSFTTADPCLNATNVTATPTSQSGQANFCWDAPASPWAFVRLKYREDVPGSAFTNIGGMGVMAPALCKTKNGIPVGGTYRVMWRTWCNVTGGPYRSAGWDGPVIWTQTAPIRLAGENTAITNLEVYPNPSRDIFNVSFVSDEVQNLAIRIINVVGEAVYTADLDQFVGQFTKEVRLATYPKGVYFLEITTDKGVINKKLILQ